MRNRFVCSLCDELFPLEQMKFYTGTEEEVCVKCYVRLERKDLLRQRHEVMEYYTERCNKELVVIDQKLKELEELK